MQKAGFCSSPNLLKPNVYSPRDSICHHLERDSMGQFRTGAARLSAGHHCLAAVFITLYGYHVCSIISALDLITWAVTLVPVLLMQWTMRWLAVSVAPSTRSASSPNWAFSLELLAFALGGILIGVINTKVHGVPVTNGVKVALSFLALGLFAALDQAILGTRERLKQGGLSEPVETVRLSLATQLAWLLGSMIALVVAIAGALMLRLLDEPGPDTGQTLAIELAVLFASFSAYSAYVLSRAHQVFSLALAEQLSALGGMTSGGASRRARIAMRDEIGMISTRVNWMLDALQTAEQQRIIAHAAMLRGLIGLAGTRDNETGQHLARTQKYVETIAAELAKQPHYLAVLTPEVIKLCVAAAPLHDIGKVAIPDAILLKSGKLTHEEFAMMQTHVGEGVRVIDAIIAEAGESPFLLTAREMVGGHHEKFDGSGYPLGLKAESIPLSARLMAVADVYDALRTQRVYKPAVDRNTARQIIIDGAGKHFDPDIVSAFLVVEPVIARLSETMADAAQIRAPEKANFSIIH
ncbi:MAG: HD domain-containing protein [Phreatobacter sp.]|uniref:HD-GYP domain-containing protein n=1 Tax=Phreatobacter sp. TaxID=1966341 RepID=UPI0027374B46|nr:HD domain-containing phosphohydrolase [Phreatobacter sp.]MDP2803031.1 HD domain-containing protein [Phreatobacter sp.]